MSNRTIILGDSVMTKAWGGTAKDLTAAIIPQKVDVTIHNMSNYGQQMTRFNGFEVAPISGVDQKAGMGYLAASISGDSSVDSMLITLGGNDIMGHTIPLDFKTQYRDLLTYCLGLGINVVPCLPTWLRNNEGERADEYRCIIVTLCDQFGLHCIDLLNGIPQNDAHYDGLHLNVLGHEACADLMISKMQEWGLWGPSYE